MKKYLPFIRDLAGMSGVALVSYGGWLIFEPAGFIIAGSALVAGALLTAKIK